MEGYTTGSAAHARLARRYDRNQPSSVNSAPARRVRAWPSSNSGVAQGEPYPRLAGAAGEREEKMTTNAENYQTILNQICAETIGPLAPKIDRSGAFPERSIEALKGAGLMGAMSAAEVGGLGLGPR